MIYAIRSGQRKQATAAADVSNAAKRPAASWPIVREHQTIHIRDQISLWSAREQAGLPRIQSVVWSRRGDIRQDYAHLDKRVVAVAATAAGAGEKREYWKYRCG
jgi:hypothetical protein